MVEHKTQKRVVRLNPSQFRQRLRVLHIQHKAPTLLSAFWKEVIDATQQGVWSYDAHSHQIYHSARWKQILGYADEGTQNDLADWQSRIHPDDLALVHTAMFQHLAGETPFYESLHRIRHKDGTYLWVQDRGQVVERDANGEPLRIVGTKMHTSQRQRYQELLTRLAENVPGMLYQYELDAKGKGQFLYASPGAVNTYGLTPEELYASDINLSDRVHPDDRQRRLQTLQASASTMETWQIEYRVNLPAHGERWLSVYSKPQRLEHGGVLWHGYVRDVTSIKQQALKLEDTETLLRHLMNEMPMALCLVDETGSFYFRNRRFQEYFGFSEETPLTLDDWWKVEYPDPSYRAQVIAGWNEAISWAKAHGGEIPRKDYHVAFPDGSKRTVAIGGLVFGSHFMATFEDRAEQVAQSEHLQQLAYLDGLTGIPNRRRFDEVFDVEWRRCERSGKPLSILMIDIDHFKAYNDHYGHQVGDECLQAVAAALHTATGRGPDLLARYGGEEFVCLLPESNAQGARHIADLLLVAVQNLKRDHVASPVQPFVTVSIGVATSIPERSSTAAALLANADANLYRAKRAGRNRVVDDTSAIST